MVRAQQKLTLQAKAICRRFTAGDKVEAERLYRAVAGKGEHPLQEPAGRALLGLLAARRPLEDQRAAYEKHLARLARGLPLAGVVAEHPRRRAADAGDDRRRARRPQRLREGRRGHLEARRARGHRRRAAAQKTGDAALEHGYAPARHAVFWNIGTALLKAQGKAPTPGRIAASTTRARPTSGRGSRPTATPTTGRCAT